MASEQHQTDDDSTDDDDMTVEYPIVPHTFNADTNTVIRVLNGLREAS
jgi:hypothetical protein